MTIAVHYQTGAWLTDAATRPNTIERDRDGHFIGCGYYGCAATRCRDMLDDATRERCGQKNFLWRDF